MPRNLRVRQSPAASFFGGVVGLAFTGIGLFVAIPAIGTFGIIWTLMAAIITAFNFYNAFSQRGIATEIIEVPDEGQAESSDPESRLSKLQNLRSKSLITAEEYEKRRSEILREI